ncbi:MAG: hypothetical protein IKK15_05040 [Akkermansia sp.]|nr:hypothetical protein [Akkermansia sp.]
MSLENFIKDFAELFDDTDSSEIQATTIFQELEEWSSLIAMTLVAYAKTEFNISLSGKEIKECKTVEDLYKIIASK